MTQLLNTLEPILVLGTKAETLARLLPHPFNIPAVFYFTVEQWRRDPEHLLDEIRHFFQGGVKRLAVRSSALAEDHREGSLAGAFTSVLNAPLHDPVGLAASIETVIASYSGLSQDQILLQPMVENILLSGVVMTRCLEDGSPYYVINYDDESGTTDAITGGRGLSKTVYIFKGVKDSDFDSPRLRKILQLARKAESYFGREPLDIEFGMDKDHALHLFQVRRICAGHGWRTDVEQEVSEKILFVEEAVREHFKAAPGILGQRTILGVMPDWNPAEIIGVTPQPLAASLYRDIVTRRIWSQARETMGYRRLPPVELMVMIAGRPYIDVRNSFNSFLPEGIDENVGARLVDAWIARLDAHPMLHDKVEFEVALTIHDPNFDASFQDRYSGLLSSKELGRYKELLLGLTNSCLDLGPRGSLAEAVATVQGLEESRNGRRETFDEDSPREILDRVRDLLDACRESGTLPFSIIARHAFIAEAFLRAIMARGAIAPERVALFRRSVKTVAGELTADFKRVSSGRMDRKEFLRRYGHLRPGTYNILSPRYLDRTDLFEGCASALKAGEEVVCFTASGAEKAAIDSLLRSEGMTIGAEELFEYARRAIVWRERAKFVFTGNLSDALEGLAAWGERHGLGRAEVSCLTLRDIQDMPDARSAEDSPRLRRLIAQGEALSRFSRSLKLGYLIRSTRDVYIVPQHRDTPNFITAKRAEGEVVFLDDSRQDAPPLAGRIACIENADPGFDWIFTRGIRGLITKYGGTNSHMAIRCAEYGLPAAIGCGEVIFEKVRSARRCLIDGSEMTVRPLDRDRLDQIACGA